MPVAAAPAFDSCDCTFCSPPPDDPCRERARNAVSGCACPFFSRREILSSVPVSGLSPRRSAPEASPRSSSRVAVSLRSFASRCCGEISPIVPFFCERTADLVESRSTRCAPPRRAVVPCSSVASPRRESSRWYCHLCDRRTNPWCSRSNWTTVSCLEDQPGAGDCCHS